MTHAVQEQAALPEPRGPLASRTLAMPANTNPRGNIFEGWIMALMDAAASMIAAPYAEHSVVTIAVSNIVFLRPVKVGDAVCCYTARSEPAARVLRSMWRSGFDSMDAKTASR